MCRAGLAALIALLLGLATAHADPSRASQILQRLNNANQWRDHVMVVAHRGGGMMERKSRYPENSRAAVEASIAAGAEMVEIDVQKTREGVYVVLHDTWLDRTTTCRGQLIDRTLAELKACRLIVEGTGQATGEGIPTLRDMLETTRGRILVNIDNKLEPKDLIGMIAVARSLGIANEVVVKQNLWNDARVAEARAIIERLGRDVTFMPIIADDAVKDVGFLDEATQAVGAHAAELINWRNGASHLTSDGGPLFSVRARAIAAKHDWHLWVDTYAIVNKEGGFLAGGRGDELAVAAGLPAESWGFWVDRGVTIIQTDEPRAAIEWLKTQGMRIPYVGEGGAVQTTAVQAAMAGQ